MTKNRGGSRDILYNRCSNQDKVDDDEEEGKEEERITDGNVIHQRRLRPVLSPPPNSNNNSQRCSTCCLPTSSLLLKIQFAFFIILTLSAIPAFYLLRREWQTQQAELHLQINDLNDKLQLYNIELDAFANGQYADFYASPQTSVDDTPEEERDELEDGVRVKSRGQRRHVMPSAAKVAQDRRTVKKRLPPGHMHGWEKSKVAADGQHRHAKGKRLVPGSLRRSSVGSDVSGWDAQMMHGATSTVNPTVHSDTEYVWLTSHSRIPLYALKEFCQATRAHCVHDMEAFLSSPEVNVRLRGVQGEKGTPGAAGHCSCPPPSASTLRRSVPHYSRDSESNGMHNTSSKVAYTQGERGAPGPRGAKGERGPPGPPGVCAIKCIDEDLLPSSRPSSYWSSSSFPQQAAHPSAGASYLVPTTNNPYLAQAQESTSTSTAAFNELQHFSTSVTSATDGSLSSTFAGDMQLPQPPRIWQEKDMSTTSTSTQDSLPLDLLDQTVPYNQTTISTITEEVNGLSVPSTTSQSTDYEEVVGPMVNAEDLPTPSPSPLNGLDVNTVDVSNTHSQEVALTGYKPRLPIRKRSCFIEAIGKPVLMRSPPVAGEHGSTTTTAWGSVMRDAHPATPEQAAKYYLTEQFTGRQLLEYSSLAHFKLFTPTLKYSLPKTFRGVGHLVYNGSFYYHVDTQPLIVKFDLATERITAKKIVDGAAYRHGHYIYNLNKNYDYMDFAADEHGLWLIYTTEHSTNAMIAHLDPHTLDILFTRNISFSHRHMGNAFVACGIFYGLSTVHFPFSHLVLAYDLLEDRYYQPPKEALFTNPRQKSVMVDYNPHDRKLYSYDDGWPLFFPLKFSQLNPENL